MQHGVFAHRYWSEVGKVNILDATWARKWKSKDGQWTVKSRLCARGFLDKQELDILRHPSTASRLSHNIACSLSVGYGWDVEAWDISTAFPQGLKFSEVQKKARELGHDTHVPRQVFMLPPTDVWRILHKLDPYNFPHPSKTFNSILEVLKAAYGLAGAPLLWKMSLLSYIKTLGGQISKVDENFVTWRDETGELVLVMFIHADDIFVTGKASRPGWALNEIQTRFGKLK